jgi:hypothetical protein
MKPDNEYLAAEYRVLSTDYWILPVSSRCMAW